MTSENQSVTEMDGVQIFHFPELQKQIVGKRKVDVNGKTANWLRIV
jgi:hypothetical protein